MASAVFFCDLDFYIDNIEPQLGDITFKELRSTLPKNTRGVFAARNCVKKGHFMLNMLSIHFGLQTEHFAKHGY
jgi:hypothetical protein